MVKQIHIVQMHALKALIQTGDQVFSAAPVSVWAFPHIISRLGGHKQFVPVRMPVGIHMPAEIGLRCAIGRAVVIGQVKMGDPVVKGCAQKRLLDGEWRNVAKVVPQSQGQQRQQHAAVPAPAILHGMISCFIGDIHACTSSEKKRSPKAPRIVIHSVRESRAAWWCCRLRRQPDARP